MLLVALLPGTVLVLAIPWVSQMHPTYVLNVGSLQVDALYLCDEKMVTAELAECTRLTTLRLHNCHLRFDIAALTALQVRSLTNCNRYIQAWSDNI